MAWYRYTGNVVRSIPVKKGITKAVRPHTVIEILEETRESKALIRKNLLRKTGKPRGAKSLAATPAREPVDLAGVLPKPEQAKKIAEKGKTTHKSKPPKAKKPEHTEGELEGANVEKGAEKAEVLESDAAEADPADEGDGKKKKRRRKKK
jgi:hypothetical protein